VYYDYSSSSSSFFFFFFFFSDNSKPKDGRSKTQGKRIADDAKNQQ